MVYVNKKTVETLEGVTETSFLWDENQSLLKLISDETHEYVYAGGSAPAIQYDVNDTPSFIHVDALGSVRLLTDSDGVETGSSSYSLYGTETSSGLNHSSFGFSGEYTDAESDLIYLRARYYEPSTGQFISRDPVWDASGQPYSYAAGNPLQLSDPSGMLPGWMKSAGKKAMNFVAGAADSYSFGAPSWALDNIGLSGIYDKCSTMFKAGSITANIVPLNGPFKAAQLARGASKVVNTAKTVDKAEDGIHIVLKHKGDPNSWGFASEICSKKESYGTEQSTQTG